MANTRFGNFSNLSQGKKPISDEEALAILTNLGFIGQEFIPGATSIRKVMEGKPREAVEELQDWIPGNAAYQNWLNDKPQDWTRNAIDAMIMGKPITKGAKKAFEAIERMPKGSKEGFLRLKKPAGQNTLDDFIEASNEAGQKITPEIEKEIRNYINSYEKGKTPVFLQLGMYDALSPESKQVIDGYMWQKTANATKPKGFDNWSAKQRAEYIENHYIKPEGKSPILTEKMLRSKKDENYGLNHQNYGSIFPDKISLDDYIKASDERETELAATLKAQEMSRAAREEKKANAKAAKEARWKAEREAEAKRAEINRLTREAEQKRIAEEAEQKRLADEAEAKLAEEKRLAEEAERKSQEEEFERQFREEEASERNRYADSVGTALGMEAVNKDIDDWLLERMIEDEENQRLNRPIEMVQVEDYGNGILHNEGPAAVPQGGRRNTYDHSRQFMDTELKQVPPIDRTGMIYGDNTDAMYDIYKAWRDSKPNDRINQLFGYDVAGSNAIRKLKDEAKRSKNQSNTMIIATDPYYAAGVVGDSNVRLWNKIDALKAEGKTDKEIREILKDDLNKYQGQIERFKERMPSKGHGSQFEYDGATTQTLKALPSEEARALKALGIDTPEYNDLERLGNFYRVFFPK